MTRTHLVLVLALASLTGLAPAQPPSLVVTATVTREKVSPTRNFLATSRPSRRAVVHAEVAGKVAALEVEEGDLVTPQTQLARLRPEVKKLELAVARADRDVTLEEKAELDAGSRPEEIRAARAKVLAARVKVEYRNWLVRRGTDLKKTGAIREEEFEEWRFEEKSAQAALEQAEAELQLVLEGPRLEVKAQAKARLALREARIAELVEQVRLHQVNAPFAGVVSRKLAEKGQWVERSAGLVEIVALEPLELEVPVPEGDLTWLRRGLDVTVRFRGFDRRDLLARDDPARATTPAGFEATIHRILPEADARSRTVPVRLRLKQKNPVRDGEHVLLAGLSATVTLPVAAPVEGTLVPKDALVLGGPSPIVYVFQPQEGAPAGGPRPGKVIPVPVVLGRAVGDRILVEGKLEPGGLVVVEGNERLRPMAPALQAGHRPSPGAAGREGEGR
jgi:HlyD family secretion protein